VTAKLAELAAACVHGEPPLPALAELGCAEPEKARADLCAAAAHPDLRPHAAAWLAPLLCSARPGAGASRLAEIASRYRQTRGQPIPPALLASLARVVGSSGFLARLLLRHSHWVEHLAVPLAGAEGAALASDTATTVFAGPIATRRHDVPEDADWTWIRIHKYQTLLRIAAHDLAGEPFATSLGALSHLADRCLYAALRCAAHELPHPPPTLLALGKLGGSELNFSSDVDLLFVYDEGGDEDQASGGVPAERHEAMVRVVQQIKHHMEVASEDGFAFRVDLDLRPAGRSGPLAYPVGAALRYYESFGAEWERQALIRLRHVAGPIEPAQALAAGLAPFVYRRGIDLMAIRRVREMKARIELERRQAGRDIERDLKEGPGGIRDVELLVQALQLFHGGRMPELRTGNVLEALAVLRHRRLLPEAAATALREGYLWLRRAEHAVQLDEERQAHHLPDDAQAQIELARRMGYPEVSGAAARARMLDDWTRVRAEVRHHFDSLVLAVAREEL
jgi:glutamate-ammonia-ligase adenylyltransferase